MRHGEYLDQLLCDGTSDDQKKKDCDKSSKNTGGVSSTCLLTIEDRLILAKGYEVKYSCQ